MTDACTTSLPLSYTSLSAMDALPYSSINDLVEHCTIEHYDTFRYMLAYYLQDSLPANFSLW
jgi:hypothetical protein